MPTAESLMWPASPFFVSRSYKPIGKNKNAISEDSRCEVMHVAGCFWSHTHPSLPSPLKSYKNEKAESNTLVGWFSHPVSRGSCRHHITPSGHPFSSKISQQHICLCAESTWCAFKENPALSWHSSEIPWVKSLTFFFFFLKHGTVNIYTIIKIASTTIFSLLLSFNTFL